MAIANPTPTRELDPQLLSEALTYDAETGALTWKTRPLHHFKDQRAADSWNTRLAGRSQLGSADRKGYRRININGTPHAAHRLIWLLVHGELPPEQIDHINGNKGDNRLCNLRAASASSNQHNRPVNANNSSGFKNVCWHALSGKWRSYIVVNYKQKSLGLHDTREAAYAAFCKAAAELHGEFANLG